MRIEKKSKESWSDWEPVSVTYAKMILGDHYKDVGAVIETMKEGHEVQTTFSWWRIIPDDHPSNVMHLIQHMKENGEEETAKKLEEYLAKGYIRNVNRRGEEI